MRHTPLLTVLLSLPTAANAAQDNPIGFLEDFALAPDRTAVLPELVPGTPDYYFYHCLARQHSEEFDAVDGLLRTWIQRHGRGGRVEEIENRQALLRAGERPAESFEFLSRRLGLSFDHRPDLGGDDEQLPSHLDPDLISTQTLTRAALAQHSDSLSGFADSMLGTLAASELSERQLRELLTRLPRPTVANLPQLVVRELGTRKSRGFGSLAIHGRLLLEQLDECARLRPSLLNEEAFVSAYLTRLVPGADVAWTDDAAEREAYLERLQSFVGRLAPVHNALKAHVLAHRLRHDMALGRMDRERFLAWLALPRKSSWSNPQHRRRHRNEEVIGGPTSFATDLGPGGDDEQLLRAYLQHFFAGDAGYEVFAPTVSDRLLGRLFAETKILLGAGDMERWYSLLDDPAAYEALRERVEIEFPPTQATRLAADEPVTIEGDVKNVQTLLVKVFEIDAFAYYRATGREVDASIPLDGLIAGEETTQVYDDNPLRRVRRTFRFPALARPGVFVVELIGGGLSSRAVIRKGSLQLRERASAAGHAFVVLDETGVVRPEATLHFGGREYSASESGEILVPYSTEPGKRTVILTSGAQCSLASFDHQREHYALEAGVLVHREALLAGHTAQLLLRPRLSLAGEAVDLSLLEDAVLDLTSTRADGVGSSVEVRGLALAADREWVHELQVPAGTVELTARLRGRVRSLSGEEPVELASSPRSFALNRIETTERTACPLLGRDAQGWFLEMRGKNGEGQAGEALDLALAHADFTDTVAVRLRTDGAGRIRLGDLEDIVSLRTSQLPAGLGAWRIAPTPRRLPRHLHGVSGRTLRVPLAADARADAVSLLELRSGAFAHDRSAHLARNGQYLELRDLPAGDYELFLPDTVQRSAVRITAGEIAGGWGLGRDRWLELSPRSPLQLAAPRVEGEDLVIEVRGATAATRVHILASRYRPPYDAVRDLRLGDGGELGLRVVAFADTDYASGRAISDEYRYVLERRFARTFPGNMLERPGLLLNPWAVNVQNDVIGIGGGAGGSFGGRSGGRRGRAAGGAGIEQAVADGRDPGTFPALDFLPDPSWILPNLRPADGGVLRIPLTTLGPGQQVEVLAVDRAGLARAEVALPLRPFTPRDRRLTRAIDADRHLVERRRIDFLTRGESALVSDSTPEEVEVYDCLSDIYRLFRTRRPDAGLEDFAFLLEWPELDEAARRSLYSRYACHELHLFLWRKDRAFFDSVVRPFLAHKVDRTFVDRWLLGEDLTAYLEPWGFAQLNVMEQALLAQRLPALAAAVARHVRERVELDPTSARERAEVYEEILLGAALQLQDRESALDLEEGLGELSQARGPATPGPAEARDALKALGYTGGVDDAPALSGAGDFDLERNKNRKTLRADTALRDQVRGLHIELKDTERLVESHYWRRTIARQGPDMLAVHEFWLDFADLKADEPFVSTHFPLATGSLNEMLLALALLDVPFESGRHALSTSEAGVEISAASALLLVRKERVDAALADEAARILVAQDLFRLSERHRMENGRRVEAFLHGPLETGVAYGCRVVVTNPTEAPHDFEVLLQIPAGALPLKAGRATRGVPLEVGAYGTATLEYAFYFPQAGEFPHYPAHVADGGELVAFADPSVLSVRAERASIDEDSWEYVSQLAPPEAVWAHLDRANLRAIDLHRIAWRMRDAAFYRRTLELLRERLAYHHGLWSYALHHGDARAAGEYLRHSDGFLARCGSALASPLLEIDPVVRRSFERIEYAPLVNARAHAFGGKREITNVDVKRQYTRLLDVLAHRASLDDSDWMSVCTFLLLQDRVADAQAAFARVDPDALGARIQYDYMRAYLDFFTPDHALARPIAEAYLDHPVPHWRDRFRAVLRHVDEAGGVALETAGGSAAAAEELVASEPVLELALEGSEIELRHAGLQACELRFYALDVEFLFSTSPFVQGGGGEFAFVQPNRRRSFPLDSADGLTRVELPEEFARANVLVEARGGGIVRRVTRYANSLALQMIEAHGQLKVTHAETGAPIAAAYVKVYSRTGDSEVFHKDGYTDLRGRFDYISVSGTPEVHIERLAVLVLSPNDGAVIREVAPPAR
ncbi:MAG: hypothetical protein CMJ84_15785 [Planctomycetes bacterium]|nr:hypothetical protein [Planctomycetota bacterium]